MRAVISGPPIFQHKHSLENTATIVIGERADEGVAFNPNGCEVIFAHDSGCWVGDQKAIQQCHLAEFDAFLLELTLGWALADLPADPKARAVEAMAVGTSAILERCAAEAPAYVAAGTGLTVPVLSAGISTSGITGKAATTPARIAQPYLTNALAVTGGGTGPAAALGALEAKLVDASDHIGGGGTIWASPAHFGGATGIQDQVCEHNGGLYTIATGSRVIVGNIGPDEMYATIGGVDLYLGPIEILDAENRKQNEYIVQVERYGVAVWNICAAFKRAAV